MQINSMSQSHHVALTSMPTVAWLKEGSTFVHNNYKMGKNYKSVQRPLVLHMTSGKITALFL